MSALLIVNDRASSEEWQRLADRYPENPFCTRQFVESCRQRGSEPLLLQLAEGSRGYAGCVAFLKSGRLTRRLVIHSVPDVRDTSSFWSSLVKFCLRGGIAELELNTFGSSPGVIPNLGHVLWRRARTEFLLDLDRHPVSCLSTNHRRNILKAERAGVAVRVTQAQAACEIHARLIQESAARRAAAGEEGPPWASTGVLEGLIGTGAGSLYQAVLGDDVCSSILVLKARQGAYYHSAGSSKNGMEVGASHFLVHATAEILGPEGVLRFNLGGADGEGLRRFKSGFGARTVELESACYFLGNNLHKQAMNLVLALRRASSGAWRRVLPKMHQ
jgi:hypothetical protein